MAKYLRAVVTAGAVVGAVTLMLMPLPYPLAHQFGLTRLGKLADFGHFAVFALVTLCAWWALRRGIWIAFALALGLCIACEAGQLACGRTANWGDVLRGILGATTAVVFLRALERPRTVGRITGHLLLTGALLVWPIADCLPAVLDSYDEYRRFPMICDFQSPWQSARWLGGETRMQPVEHPKLSGRRVGQLPLIPGKRGCGGQAFLFPVVLDWSGYQQLCCEGSFEGGPLSIAISITTYEQRKKRSRRYHRATYQPGTHQIWIDLLSVSSEGPGPPHDLSRMHSLRLQVAADADAPREFYLHRLYLK